MQSGIERQDLKVSCGAMTDARVGGATSGSRVAAATLPPTIAALVAIFIPIVRDGLSEVWASALWGLLLIFAFVGWGRLVNRWHRPLAPRDWGLDGTVGMACFLWAGAVLAGLRLVSPNAIWLIVFGGIGAHAYDRLREPPSDHLRGKRLGLRLLYRGALAGVFLLGLLAYADSVMCGTFNIYDDLMSYLGLARKLLEAGHMAEPFSARRLASFGGQTVLLAAMAAVAPLERLHAIDTGICVLLVLGLIAGYGTTAARRAGTLLSAVLFICIRHPHHNLASEMSGLLYFLAIFRVLDDSSLDGKRSSANAVVIGLLSATACTLRQNFISAVAVTLAAYYALRLVAAASAERRRLLKEGVLVAGTMLIALAPWMLMSFANSRTFLYPLLKGNSNPEWGLMGKVDLDEEGRWFLINMFYPEPVRTLGFFVPAVCLLRSSRVTAAVRAQFIGALVGFVLLVHVFQTSTYPDSVERYYFSFVMACILAVTLRVLSGNAPSRPRFVPAILVVMGLGLHLFATKGSIGQTFAAWLNSAKSLAARRNPTRERGPDGNTTLYRRLQSTVPANASMLVMVEYSHLFDFKRNDIVHFDQPGATSPPPHVPFFQGPEAFAEYFLGLGIRYVAFIIGASNEYTYPIWRAREAMVVPEGKRGAMYKMQARYALDTFDNFMALTLSRKVLAHEGDYWVLDLESRP